MTSAVSADGAIGCSEFSAHYKSFLKVRTRYRALSDRAALRWPLLYSYCVCSERDKETVRTPGSLSKYARASAGNSAVKSLSLISLRTFTREGR